MREKKCDKGSRFSRQPLLWFYPLFCEPYIWTSILHQGLCKSIKKDFMSTKCSCKHTACFFSSASFVWTLIMFNLLAFIKEPIVQSHKVTASLIPRLGPWTLSHILFYSSAYYSQDKNVLMWDFHLDWI